MDRISTQQLELSFERMTAGARRVGIDTSKWILEQGSTTYGRPYRMFRIGDESGNGSGHYNPLANMSNGYLGWTRREVLCALDAMATAFHAAADASIRAGSR